MSGKVLPLEQDLEGCDGTILMHERLRPTEQMLELNDDDSVTPELLDSQVQRAQEQLLALKRQQDQIEKQKRELEELSRRQEELDRGRSEMTDKLTRSLVILEREAYDAQKRLEQVRATRESFGQHLEFLETIDPKSWNASDLHKELSRALSTVDDARTEFSQQRSRLQAIATQDSAEDTALPEAAPELTRGTGERSFGEWVLIGFALSLPLIAVGLVALVISFWMTKG